MKEKEFDRIVRELQNGKRELLKRGITFCLSGRNNATGQTWYASNRERNMSDVKHTEERTETHACVSPCDVCRHYPPSSVDGKPCSMCPAEGRSE